MTVKQELLISGIDPKAWVLGCIDKVKSADDWKTLWNKAWFETYIELGGLKESVGNKSCPKNCVKGLYEFGRIKGADRPYKQVDISVLIAKYGYKNAIYGLAACEKLKSGSYESSTELAVDVYSTLQNQYAMNVPKGGDQGPVKITYMLNELSLLNLPEDN
jgi:hypothetical protein